MFHELYFQRLLRYLLVVTGGREEAAREALQIALLRVVRHIRRFDREAVFWSWLTVLARSAVVDEERKRHRYLAFLDRFFRREQIEAATNVEADARLQDLSWPPDLVWLGMGNDGHTASIFAGPDLQNALDAPKARRAIGVMPDPLPAEAPVARVTLTRAAILSARTVTITITGDEKRALLEQAIADGQSSKLPIGRVLAEIDQPIDIHWAP